MQVVVDGLVCINIPFTIRNETNVVWTEISTAQQLIDLTESDDPAVMNADYLLTADIDLSTASHWYNPLGHLSKTPFTGIFDGNGYSIVGGSIGDDNTRALTDGYVGMFYQIAAGAVVRNLTIDLGTANYIRGEEGMSMFTHDNYGTIENCFAKTGKVFLRTGAKTKSTAAGFVYNNYGTIKNCLSMTYVHVYEIYNPWTLGALVYQNLDGGQIVNSFVYANAAIDAAGRTNALASVAGKAGDYDAICIKTKAELQTASTYLTANFDTGVWEIADDAFPTLRNGCTKHQ